MKYHTFCFLTGTVHLAGISVHFVQEIPRQALRKPPTDAVHLLDLLLPFGRKSSQQVLRQFPKLPHPALSHSFNISRYASLVCTIFPSNFAKLWIAIGFQTSSRRAGPSPASERGFVDYVLCLTHGAGAVSYINFRNLIFVVRVQ